MRERAGYCMYVQDVNLTKGRTIWLRLTGRAAATFGRRGDDGAGSYGQLDRTVHVYHDWIGIRRGGLCATNALSQSPNGTKRCWR